MGVDNKHAFPPVDMGKLQLTSEQVQYGVKAIGAIVAIAAAIFYANESLTGPQALLAGTVGAAALIGAEIEFAPLGLGALAIGAFAGAIITLNECGIPVHLHLANVHHVNW